MAGTFTVGILSLLALVAIERPDWVHTAVDRTLSVPVTAATTPPDSARVTLPAGTYRPQFPPSPSETRIQVAAFALDVTPVTNAQFASFVVKNPEWQRGRAPELFVDHKYLAHWDAPTLPGRAGAERPVTHVSWFAAKAYCEARGARLPSEAEWEHAASASETAADGRQDPAWSARILKWYSRPAAGPERDVGQGERNHWGVYDLHGLVWEWVLDFNSTMVNADSRRATDNDRLAFCGASALGATAPEDYASFMRSAMRSSLEARRAGQHGEETVR